MRKFLDPLEKDFLKWGMDTVSGFSDGYLKFFRFVFLLSDYSSRKMTFSPSDHLPVKDIWVECEFTLLNQGFQK